MKQLRISIVLMSLFTFPTESLAQKSLVEVVPAVAWACAVYDPVRERMVVFGGRHQTTASRQTWALSLGAGTPAWTHVLTTGAPPVQTTGAAAAYDSFRDRMIVIGGADFPSNGPEMAVYELRFAENRWYDVAVSGFPPPRVGHSIVYDPLGDRVIMFGGDPNWPPDEGLPDPPFLGDTWELKFSGPLPGPYPRWQPITSPGAPYARTGHSAFYDPGTQQMFVMGGFPSQTQHVKFWTLSLPATGTPVWTELDANWAPSARLYQTAIFDPAEQRAVVYGGRKFNTTEPCLDLNTYSLWFPQGGFYYGWGQYQGAPFHRFGHVAVFDPHPPNNRMIVFGGMKSTETLCNPTFTNETWSFPLIRNSAAANWEQLSSTTEPPARLAPTETPVSNASFSVQPNPLRNRAQFSVSVPTSQQVTIDVFDIAGRHVDRIADLTMPAGEQVFEWGVKGTSGQRVRPGVYRCRLTGETFHATRTMVVLP